MVNYKVIFFLFFVSCTSDHGFNKQKSKKMNPSSSHTRKSKPSRVLPTVADQSEFPYKPQSSESSPSLEQPELKETMRVKSSVHSEYKILKISKLEPNLLVYSYKSGWPAIEVRFIGKEGRLIQIKCKVEFPNFVINDIYRGKQEFSANSEFSRSFDLATGTTSAILPFELCKLSSWGIKSQLWWHKT